MMSLAAGGAGTWTFVDHVSDLTEGLTYAEDRNSKAAGFEEDASSAERIYIVKGGNNNSIVTQFVDDLLGYATWDPGTGANYVPGQEPSAYAVPSGDIAYGSPSNGDTIVFHLDGLTYTLTKAASFGAGQFSTISELAELISTLAGSGPMLLSATISGTSIVLSVAVEGTAPNSWTITGTGTYAALSITFSGGPGLSARRGLQRVLPDRHSLWRNWFCTKARAEGFAIAGKSANLHAVPVHSHYRIFAYYQPVDYRCDPMTASDAAVRVDGVPKEYQRFCRFPPQETNVEILTLTGGMKFVTSPGRVLVHPPGKLHCTKLFTIEWLKVPGIGTNPFISPVDRNDVANRGLVNETEFLGYPKGTVLYLGSLPDMVTPTLANDAFYWNIVMKFAVKFNGYDEASGEARGHNYHWDVAGNRWDLATHDGTRTGTRTYQETGRFYDLFQP